MQYEADYNIKVNLIDANGLVQVDTDEINIENAYLDDVNISEQDSNAYVYQEGENGEYIVSKYIENLSWYLVVQSQEKKMDRELVQVILLNAILFSFVAFVFLISSYLTQRHTRMLIKTSYLDELTKMRNRRAYEEELAALSKEKLKPDFVYVNADVNGLKTANDTLGHTAGDELIRGAAGCLMQAFGRYGHVFRIGGDEFAAILYIQPNELEKAKETLALSVQSWQGALVQRMSISVGYVPRWEAETSTLEEIIAESDKRMYADKDDHYKKTGEKRR